MADRLGVLILTGLIVASAPLLSGCVETASATWDDVRASVGAPPAEVSAMSALNEADDAARAWRADAVLLAVSALESADVDGPAGDATYADPDVGNGRAPFWEFEYGTPNATYSFLVHANGSITDARERADDEGASEDHADATAAPAWKIDSDAAMKILRDDPNWREMTADVEAAWFADALELSPDSTDWVFFVMDSDGEGVIGIVDATTGAEVAVFRWDGMGDWGSTWEPGAWGGGNWSWGGNSTGPTYEESYVGDLTLVDPAVEFQFPVSREGEPIHLNVIAQGGTSAWPVTVAIVDSMNREVAVEHRDGSGSEGNKIDDYFAVANEPGTYTLRLTLELPGAYTRYVATLSVGGDPSGWGWPAAG